MIASRHVESTGACRDPAFAHKHPGPRLIGVAWCLGIIAWSLLIALLRSSRAPRLTVIGNRPGGCLGFIQSLRRSGRGVAADLLAHSCSRLVYATPLGPPCRIMFCHVFSGKIIIAWIMGCNCLGFSLQLPLCLLRHCVFPKLLKFDPALTSSISFLSCACIDGLSAISLHRMTRSKWLIISGCLVATSKSFLYIRHTMSICAIYASSPGVLFAPLEFLLLISL